MSPRLPGAFASIVLFITTVVLSQSSIASAAAPAPFDSSFGTNGYATTSIPPQRSNTHASAIIADSTNRLYTAINISGGSTSRVSIVRTSADGVLDTTYGTQGRSVSVALIQPSLAIQSDNKVVLAGFEYLGEAVQLQVRRYRTNGTLDTTFGKDGLFTLNSFPGNNFSPSPTAISMAINNSEDRIILGTQTYNQQQSVIQFIFIALRFNGQLDMNWNNGGARVVTPRATPAQGFSNLYAMSLLSDGSIIASGSTYNSANQNSIVLIKLTEEGFPDSDFDGPSMIGNPGNGMVIVPFGAQTLVNLTAISVLGDGSLVLAGFAGTTDVYYAMAKFTPTGIPDTNFGTGGFLLSATVYDEVNPYVSNLFTETTGTFVFPIKAGTFSGFMRVRANGTIDETNICALCLHSNINFIVYSMLLQSTGKVVLVGEHDQTFQATTVRLNDNGWPDGAFQVNPTVINEFLWSNYIVHISPQLDGSSIVVAQAFVGSEPGGWGSQERPVLFKILPNGSLDLTFGTAGYLFVTPSPNTEWSVSVPPVTQPDGKILIASIEQAFDNTINRKVALTRVLPSGAPDPTFGTDGTVTTNEAQTRLRPLMMAIGSDGKVFVTVERQGAETTDVIYRYTSSGVFEASINGVLSGSYNLRIFPANNKFMLTGNVEINGDEHAYIARINADGSLDTSFNGGGYRTWNSTEPQSAFYLTNVMVNRDGLITASGSATIPNYVEFLIQLNPDGSIRNQFGNAGRVEFTIIDPDTMRWAWHNTMLATNDEFILAGVAEKRNWQESHEPLIARINSSGQMNATFGTNGVLYLLPNDDSYFITAVQLSTNQVLIGGAIRHGDVTNGLITKMSTASTTPPTPSPPVEIIPPATTTPPSTTPPTTLVPTVIAVNTSLDISISVSRAALVRKAKLTVPRRAKVTMRVTTPRVCRVVKSTVRALSPGTCRVSLSVTTSAKKTTTRTTSFKIR